MFEQDYVMRMIKDMVRAILKLFFNIDTDSPSLELLKDAEDKQALELLMDMIDSGRIDDAENRIYEMTEKGDKRNLEIAILFYSYLNDKTDGFLKENNFSRNEINSGLREITTRFGLGYLVELFIK